ncbi:MAG: tRNA-specific adenosine deaminase [Nitrosomonadales bacterium SCN 54-20]|nr:MAG: tRNA-specific adenosine deaminase [Nitrosomonadales bacterium SCN 54-20]
MREAVRLAKNNRERGSRPFAAVLVVEGEAVSTGVNDVVQSNDPTTHAEMEAVRAASRNLGRPDLRGGIVYASGHPCPMCLAAMVIAGVDAVYYAFDNDDAEPYGFSSKAAYQKLRLSLEPPPLPLIRLDLGLSPAELYGA